MTSGLSVITMTVGGAVRVMGDTPVSLMLVCTPALSTLGLVTVSGYGGLGGPPSVPTAPLAGIGEGMMTETPAWTVRFLVAGIVGAVRVNVTPTGFPAGPQSYVAEPTAAEAGVIIAAEVPRTNIVAMVARLILDMKD